MTTTWFTPQKGVQGWHDEPGMPADEALAIGWLCLRDGVVVKREGAAEARAVTNLRAWLKEQDYVPADLDDTVRTLGYYAASGEVYASPQLQIAAHIERVAVGERDCAIGEWLMGVVEGGFEADIPSALAASERFKDIAARGAKLLSVQMNWPRKTGLDELARVAGRLHEGFNAIAAEVEGAHREVLAALVGQALPVLDHLPTVEAHPDPYVHIERLRITLRKQGERPDMWKAERAAVATFPHLKDFFKVWDSIDYIPKSIRSYMKTMMKSMGGCATVEHAENIISFYAGHETQRNMDVLRLYAGDMNTALEKISAVSPSPSPATPRP